MIIPTLLMRTQAEKGKAIFLKVIKLKRIRAEIKIQVY